MPKSRNGFSDKERAFIEHYVRCLNGARAARLAGYSERTAREIAAENLSKPRIKAEIDRCFAELKASPNEVLGRLTEYSRGDFRPFVTPDGGVDLSTAEAQEKLHLLKKVKTKTRTYRRKDSDTVETETETEIELNDPMAANVHLGRHYGLFIDKAASGDEVYREHMEKVVNALRDAKMG